MNKNCKLCNGKYNFSTLKITKCLGETSIVFTGGSSKADDNNCFKYCPECGEKLSKENFESHNIETMKKEGVPFKEQKVNFYEITQGSTI